MSRQAMSRQKASCAAVALAILGGCDEQPRPWSGQPAGQVRDESSAFLPGSQDAPLLGDGGGVPAPEPEAPVTPPKASFGGLWATCHDAFVASGQPLRDVTRLGLMCGPVNGMSKLGQTVSGRLKAGQSASHRFVARAGDCYRAFAVGSVGIEDLDIIVRSSRGSRLSSDQTDDRWPVVDRQRPFCSFHDDSFVAEVAADRGSGRYALEIWRLPGTR
jgi:hypothetical protein